MAADEVTYATSWNLQVEAAARWQGGAATCAALDEDNELGLTCDAAGDLVLWRWPLLGEAAAHEPISELARLRAPGGKAAFELLRAPRRSARAAASGLLGGRRSHAQERTVTNLRFLAVFADAGGDLGGPGGEVHAYLPVPGALRHAPLLTLKEKPLCACTHGALGELVLASRTHVRAHALRGWDAGQPRAPQRLAIALGSEQALVAASDAAGVIVAASKAGGFWCWDAYTGSALAAGSRLLPPGGATFLRSAALHAGSRLLAALEQPVDGPAPKAGAPGKRRSSLSGGAAARRACTKLWWLDAAFRPVFSPEATASVDHSGYAPLALSVQDAPGGVSNAATLVVVDSAGTVRCWVVREDAVTAVCAARLSELLPLAHDSRCVAFATRGAQRLVVVADGAVASVAAHHERGARNAASSGAGATIVALEYLEGLDVVLTGRAPAVLETEQSSKRLRLTARERPPELRVVKDDSESEYESDDDAPPTCSKNIGGSWLVGYADGWVDVVDPAGPPRELCASLTAVRAVCALTVRDRRLVIAGHADGTVAGWDLEDARNQIFRLPAHAAPVLSVSALPEVPGVALCAADGDVRVWGAPEPGDDDEAGAWALLGSVDAGAEDHLAEPDLSEDAPARPHRFTACAALEPRARRAAGAAQRALAKHVRELVLGTVRGAVEVWPLPRDDLEGARPAASAPVAPATGPLPRPLFSMRCHAAPVLAVSATAAPPARPGALPTAVALVTASADGVVRWVLDAGGLSPRERFSVSRPPLVAKVLPPRDPGDPLWRVVAATGARAAVLAKRPKRAVFGRVGAELPARPRTPPRQRHIPVDVEAMFVRSEFRACHALPPDADLGPSRARILGGRAPTQAPPAAPEPPKPRRHPPRDGSPERPKGARPPSAAGKPAVAGAPPPGVMVAAVPRGARGKYPAHLDPRRPVPTPASPKKKEPPRSRDESKPEEVETTGLKTVADRTAPSLPGSNAYTHLLLREKALGPPPGGAAAPERTSATKTMPPTPPKDVPSPSASATLVLDIARGTKELKTSISMPDFDWTPPADAFRETRPPYFANRTVEGTCAPAPRARTEKEFGYVSTSVLARSDKREKARRPEAKATVVRFNAMTQERGAPPILPRDSPKKPPPDPLLAARAIESDEADEVRQILSDKRRKKAEHDAKPVAGVRGRAWGWKDDGTGDETADEARRRKRLAALEAQARARHAAEEARKRREAEDEARRLLERQLREEAARRAALAAPPEEEEGGGIDFRPKDPRQRALYELFQTLLPPGQLGKPLLPFARLQGWGPVKASPLEGKNQIRDLWRRAHKNRHGGDRGDFRDFSTFAGLLDAAAVKARLGPKLESLEVAAAATEETGEGVVQLELKWSRGFDREPAGDDGLRLARFASGCVLDDEGRLPVETHVVLVYQTDPAPSYADVLAHRGCRGVHAVRGFEDALSMTIGGLESDMAYYAYAACVETPPDESGGEVQGRTCEAADGSRPEANRRLQKSRVAFETPPVVREAEEAVDESLDPSWLALSPEMQLTELTAALKDKGVAAEIKGAGLEMCKPADARPIERERNPDAARRWAAWEHWWPRSGHVRREFLQREMAFAAKNDDVAKAAAADGVVIHAGDATSEDPEAQQRWQDFQKWYEGGAKEEEEEEEEELELLGDDEDPWSQPAVVEKPKERKKKKKKKKLTLDDQGNLLDGDGHIIPRKQAEAESEDEASVAETAPGAPPGGAKKKPSPKKKGGGALAQALRTQARLAAAAKRMKARNAFLGGRSAKVEELKARIEEALKKHVPRKRKHLKVYVRLVMFQLRMMKDMKEKKLKPPPKDDEGLDPDGIDLFGDIDEDAIEKAIEKREEAAAGGGDDGPPEPPPWKDADEDAKKHEMILACLDPDVLGSALDAEPPLAFPDPEDFEDAPGGVRGERVADFRAWYATASVRTRFFQETETRLAYADDAIRATALEAKVRRLGDPFKRWYANAEGLRAGFLEKAAFSALSKRRAVACGRLFPDPAPEMLLALPPLAVLARPPEPPTRYELFPARRPGDRWSVPEMLHWFGPEVLDKDRLALRRLQADKVKRWKREAWERAEKQRQQVSRREMRWEDERARGLRLADVDLREAEEKVMKKVAKEDAGKARELVDAYDVLRAGLPGDYVLSSALETGFEKKVAPPDPAYRTGSGLDNGDELVDARERALREAEEAKLRKEEERRARAEAARKRAEEEEARRKEEERKERVKRTAEERARIEAHLKHVREAREKRAEAKRLEGLRKAAQGAADAARDAARAREAILDALDREARAAVEPLLEARRRGDFERLARAQGPVAAAWVPEERDDEASQLVEELRAEQRALLEHVYAPFEPMFPDDAEDPDDDVFILNEPPRTKKPRSRNPDVLPYAEAIVALQPRTVAFVETRRTDRLDRILKLPRLKGAQPRPDASGLFDALRRRRSLAQAGSLADLAALANGAVATPRERPPLPRPGRPRLDDFDASTLKSHADSGADSPLDAVPLFPKRLETGGGVAAAVGAARRRVAAVREKRERERRAVESRMPFAAPPLALGGTSMAIGDGHEHRAATSLAKKLEPDEQSVGIISTSEPASPPRPARVQQEAPS